MKRLGPEMTFVFHEEHTTLSMAIPILGSDPLIHNNPHTPGLEENKLGDLQDYESHDSVWCFLASY